MTKTFFNALYAKTAFREHVLLSAAARLYHGLTEDGGRLPYYVAGRIARQMIRCQSELDAELVQLTKQQGGRIRQLQEICPICGKTDCPEAVPVGSLLPAALHKLSEMLQAQHKVQQDNDGA
jgi:hypothetical protein